MPRRALRCVVDLSVHAVTCPGVYLQRRDDVYLSVCMFGEVRRTQLIGGFFPLLFSEKFHFDKVFYSAYEPAHVAESLRDEPVVIELIQLSDIYEGGRLLASYECSAGNFLYPYPSYSPSYGTFDRDIIMERSLDFPGIAPRLEFSTNTSIKETSALYVPDYDDAVLRASRTRAISPIRRSRSRSKKRSKSPSRISYGRPTVSSISRTRSLSPSRRLRMDGLNLESSVRPMGELKPPFKVTRVTKDLIGRTPGTPSPRQNVDCNHGTYNYRTSGYSYTDDYLDLYRGNLRPRYTYKASRLFDESSSDLESDLDSLRISRRYRSPSPLLARSTLSDRYLDSESALIKARVDAAIERNKTREVMDKLERERLDRLDRLDRLARVESMTDYRYRYPYGSMVYSPYRYDYLYKHPYTTTATDLELDLELARSRRSKYSTAPNVRVVRHDRENNIAKTEEEEWRREEEKRRWREWARHLDPGKKYRDSFLANLKKSFAEVQINYEKPGTFSPKRIATIKIIKNKSS